MGESHIRTNKGFHYSRLSTTRVIMIIVVVLGLLTSSRLVLAQDGYPKPTDLFVNDYANLLTSVESANIRQLFTDLKQERGVEAVVVTINSRNDYNTPDKTIESFATNLFNMWGIGNRTKNDGVLMLVAVKDREVRIEVGDGYGNSQDANMQEVIDEHMLPSFRNAEYSQGIYRGARAIVSKLTGKRPKKLLPRRVTESAWFFGAIIASIVGLTGGGIFGVKKYLRYRSRKCSYCHTNMKRLDEMSDDLYLNNGQKIEETFNSVDYDLWKCPSCNYQSLFRFPSLFSSFKTCPDCNHRTIKVSKVRLSEPSYTSTGSEKIIQDCQHCKYKDEKIVVIPVLTDNHNWSSGGSSSSGGGSFGGGSSSGGGASGHW